MSLNRYSVYFYVPNRLDPAWLPSDIRFEAYYLLDLIHKKWLRWPCDRNGFIPLKQSYLRRVIPWRLWPDVLKSLERHAVVECDGVARKGEKSFGYRVRPPFQSSRPVECTDARIARKVRRLRKAADTRLLPVHRFLGRGLQRVRFDVQRALEIVGTMERANHHLPFYYGAHFCEKH